MSKEIPDRPKVSEPKISIWRFLLWGVILTVLFSYFFSSINAGGQVELAYSVFKEQLRSGNIAEVFLRELIFRVNFGMDTGLVVFIAMWLIPSPIRTL